MFKKKLCHFLLCGIWWTFSWQKKTGCQTNFIASLGMCILTCLAESTEYGVKWFNCVTCFFIATMEWIIQQIQVINKTLIFNLYLPQLTSCFNRSEFTYCMSTLIELEDTKSIKAVSYVCNNMKLLYQMWGKKTLF